MGHNCSMGCYVPFDSIKASTGLFDFVMDPNTSAGLSTIARDAFPKAHCLVAPRLLSCPPGVLVPPVSSSIQRAKLKNWQELILFSVFSFSWQPGGGIGKTVYILTDFPKKNSLISKRTGLDSLVIVTSLVTVLSSLSCFCRLHCDR